MSRTSSTNWFHKADNGVHCATKGLPVTRSQLLGCGCRKDFQQRYSANKSMIHDANLSTRTRISEERFQLVAESKSD